jgi:uncharacterized protein YifE (UPF0438 family)
MNPVYIRQCLVRIEQEKFMEYQSFVSGKRFFDNAHFPRGFNRSGIFSVKEAEILTTTGVTVRELSEGTLEPSNEQQSSLQKVLLGTKEPETAFEKLWSKYYRHISTKRCPLSLSSSTAGGMGMDESSYSDY